MERDGRLSYTETFPLFIDELKNGFVEYLKLLTKSLSDQ